MRILFLFFVCSVSSLSQAQTAIIAHKSHSGTGAGFFIDPSTNFGIPSPRLVQVIRLNDSTSIEVNDHYNGYYSYDTIYNNPLYADYNLDIDSVKNKYYLKNVDYINFKKSPKSVKPIAPGYDTKRINEGKPKQQQEAPQEEEVAPKKQKKKSYLLFLFGITGGGMLLMRLFSRAKSTQQSIA